MNRASALALEVNEKEKKLQFLTVPCYHSHSPRLSPLPPPHFYRPTLNHPCSCSRCPYHLNLPHHLNHTLDTQKTTKPQKWVVSSRSHSIFSVKLVDEATNESCVFVIEWRMFTFLFKVNTLLMKVFQNLAVAVKKRNAKSSRSYFILIVKLNGFNDVKNKSCVGECSN